MFRLMPPLLTLLLASPFVHAASPNANPPYRLGRSRNDDSRRETRYSVSHCQQFHRRPLPGYGVPGAWLREQPATALAEVQKLFNEQGLGLLVYDAYRPLRGTLGMVAWAHRTDQVHLLDTGYIARRSGHNRAIPLI